MAAACKLFMEVSNPPPCESAMTERSHSLVWLTPSRSLSLATSPWLMPAPVAAANQAVGTDEGHLARDVATGTSHQLSVHADGSPLLVRVAEAGSAHGWEQMRHLGHTHTRDTPTESGARVHAHQAVAVYEEEDKQLYSQDAFRHAVVLQLRTKKWADAVATLLRFAVACDANGAEQSQRRAYLGAVVVGGTTAYTTLEGR